MVFEVRDFHPTKICGWVEEIIVFKELLFVYNFFEILRVAKIVIPRKVLFELSVIRFFTQKKWSCLYRAKSPLFSPLKDSQTSGSP